MEQPTKPSQSIGSPSKTVSSAKSSIKSFYTSAKVAFRDRTFGYKPLRGPSEIRLVRLLQGSSDEPIKCGIIHVELGSMSYETLSYEWGVPNYDDTTIAIEGQPVQVRKNLWEGLQQIRLSDKDRIIWIDALCIDQQNIKERNHQVQLMGQIYRGADQLVVWLGHPDSKGAMALDIFKSVLALNERLAKSVPGTVSKNLDHASDKFPSHAVYLRLVLPVTDEQGSSMSAAETSIGVALSIPDQTVFLSVEQVQSIKAWEEQSYWYRIWILQEIRLARKIELHNGRHKFSDSDILFLRNTMIGSTLSCFHPTHRSMWRSMCNHTMGFRLLSDRSCGSKITLRGWILDTEYSKSTEPRDQIYALLGVASDCTGGIHTIPEDYLLFPSRDLFVDYSISLIDLCIATLHHCNYGYMAIRKLTENLPGEEGVDYELATSWEQLESEEGWEWQSQYEANWKVEQVVAKKLGLDCSLMKEVASRLEGAYSSCGCGQCWDETEKGGAANVTAGQNVLRSRPAFIRLDYTE
jgi:hypothetical protein